MRLEGLEPPRPKAPDSKSGVAAITPQAQNLERVAGNDPAFLVWQTSVIPLYDTRKIFNGGP